MLCNKLLGTKTIPINEKDSHLKEPRLTVWPILSTKGLADTLPWSTRVTILTGTLPQSPAGTINGAAISPTPMRGSRRFQVGLIQEV